LLLYEPVCEIAEHIHPVQEKRMSNQCATEFTDTSNINLLLTEREGRTGEYWPEVLVVRTEHSVQKRPRANTPQYGPEQVKLVSRLLYGIIFVRNITSGGSFKSISGAVSRKEAGDFNWLSNQFDDRCCRSAKTCVALK